MDDRTTAYHTAASWGAEAQLRIKDLGIPYCAPNGECPSGPTGPSCADIERVAGRFTPRQIEDIALLDVTRELLTRVLPPSRGTLAEPHPYTRRHTAFNLAAQAVRDFRGSK